MRLTDIPGLLIKDMTRSLRRWAIAGAVILVCGIAAVIEAVSAARHALEPLAGPVGARLIVMAIFIVVAVATALLLLRGGRSAATSASRGAARERSESEDRVAIIAEAIGLGYSLGQDFGKASRANGAHPAGGRSADHASADDTAPRT